MYKIREMKVSRSKAEYLCVNGGNDKETVKMEDIKVPRVQEFKYLGSTMQKTARCEREVKSAGRMERMEKNIRSICDRGLPDRVKKSVRFSGQTRNGVWT